MSVSRSLERSWLARAAMNQEPLARIPDVVMLSGVLNGWSWSCIQALLFVW